MAPTTDNLQAFVCVWTAPMWHLAERMLYDLDRVLKAYGVRSFMVYGTFLGAIRHQGVIPWDDDLDMGIFGDDESRLLQAQDALRRHGYHLQRHQIPWDHKTLSYYKVWIASRPSRTGYFYSWPFVDIWVFRPTGRSNTITDGELVCQQSDILPLKPYPFGNLCLDGPHGEALLIQAYGTDYTHTCVSSYLNHREEKRLRPVTMRREDVQRHGYFVQVHTSDALNDGSTPYPKHGLPAQANGIGEGPRVTGRAGVPPYSDGGGAVGLVGWDADHSGYASATLQPFFDTGCSSH